MLSKEALIFQNRIKSFDEDLEMIDVLKIALEKSDLLRDDEVLFKYVSKKRHINLYSKKVTMQSRKIVVNHLRNTIYSSYLKDLYEELTDYLKALLSATAKVSKEKSKALRLMGEHTISIKASDILQFNSIEDLATYIAESIIQSLENERSTKELIKKVCKKIDLQIDEEIINVALPYLEIRHKLVHTNGLLDVEFKKNYPKIQCNNENYVTLNYALVNAARDAVTNLVFAIDEKALEKKLLPPNTPINDKNE